MVAELVERVAREGVILSVEGGKLRGHPAHKLAPFIAELKQHRADVIVYLTRPKATPDEWAEVYMAWLSSRCAVDTRFMTNLLPLYRDFAAWCEARNDWPCDRDAFEALLAQSGLVLTAMHGVTLVENLALAADAQTLTEPVNRVNHQPQVQRERPP